MALDDAAAAAATHDTLGATEHPCGGPVDRGPVRLGGPVVAGPPDDAFEAGQHEIFAALFGAPTPGAM